MQSSFLMGSGRRGHASRCGGSLCKCALARTQRRLMRALRPWPAGRGGRVSRHDGCHVEGKQPCDAGGRAAPRPTAPAGPCGRCRWAHVAAARRPAHAARCAAATSRTTRAAPGGTAAQHPRQARSGCAGAPRGAQGRQPAVRAVVLGSAAQPFNDRKSIQERQAHTPCTLHSRRHQRAPK